jgi:hypothetical protein
MAGWFPVAAWAANMLSQGQSTKAIAMKTSTVEQRFIYHLFPKRSNLISAAILLKNRLLIVHYRGGKLNVKNDRVTLALSDREHI